MLTVSNAPADWEENSILKLISFYRFYFRQVL